MQYWGMTSSEALQTKLICSKNLLLSLSFKVHLTPKLFFGRDETVQQSHEEFDNFISIWYF